MEVELRKSEDDLGSVGSFERLDCLHVRSTYLRPPLPDCHPVVRVAALQLICAELDPHIG
jgi:hypothetical protein